MVSQREVLEFAISQANISAAKAANLLGMSKHTLYGNINKGRNVSWGSLNDMCVKICGRTAYSLAMSISTKKAISGD